MRPAAGGFSGFSAAPKKASWDELARDRDTDGETKNYSVPPELIELARANRKGRGQVGTLTPLAPKPERDVVVVVPATAPLKLDLAPSSSSPESSLQAPSVPVPAAESHEPDSARTVVYPSGNVASSRSESSSPVLSSQVVASQVVLSPKEPSRAAPSSEMLRAELDAADEPETSEALSLRPSSRRSSRRARRSLRVEMPVEATIAARAAATAQSPRLVSYLPYATGVALVGAYILLCYYANALLSGLP